MECKEFQEHISPAVDRLLQKDSMESFEKHAEVCPTCRREYVLESMTKTLVRDKAKLVRTPGELVQRVTEQLMREGRAAPAGMNGWWSNVVASRYAKPALAVGAAGIAVVILFSRIERTSEYPAQAANPTNNVITQSLANYQAVVSGTIQPQQVSDDPQHLIGYFAGKTDFTVLVPQLAGCTLVGGVLDEYFGTTLAHVVYRHDGNIVYMYEACWETVRKGQKLHLPERIHEGLVRSGWFAETQPDGKTVVLWTKGNTLCAAVARMNKEDLLACLSAAEDNSGNTW